MKHIISLLLVTAALLLSVALPLLPAAIDGDEYYGLTVEASVPALPLEQADQTAELRVVFFGYRSCSTVCPIQFGNMMQLQKRLQGLPIEFVFVTLDPERDTQPLLEKTAAELGPQFLVIRPESIKHAQMLALAYGGVAAKVQHPAGYDFNHSANLYVVTNDWQRRLIYTRQNLDIQRVEADLLRMLATR